jgi:calcineurin-like phosphoesterase family protein
MQQVWFTSDTHFGHENVIKYSNRPYRDKWEMDEAMINNWNSRVSPDDLVYHLGDFFFCNEDRAVEILNRLNGQKVLVLGNHDKRLRTSQRLREHLSGCFDYKEVVVQGQHIVLCHYAMLTWNKAHYGAWMLHGHSHGSLRYPFDAKIHDVGVDPNNYHPLSFDDLSRIMSKKKFVSVDHHD